MTSLILTVCMLMLNVPPGTVVPESKVVCKPTWVHQTENLDQCEAMMWGIHETYDRLGILARFDGMCVEGPVPAPNPRRVK